MDVCNILQFILSVEIDFDMSNIDTVIKQNSSFVQSRQFLGGSEQYFGATHLNDNKHQYSVVD